MRQAYKGRKANVYELRFYKSGYLVKPSIDLSFEYPVKDNYYYIGERDTDCIRGLIIDRHSKHTVTLLALPLITCSAYIFSFSNYDGVEKAIIYHTTSIGPKHAGWIASQIASETDLSTVSIIIATPADDLINPDSGANLIDISEDHSVYLQKVGFTGKVQILFGCNNYIINSKGKHGCGKCTYDLVFHKATRFEAYADHQEEEQGLDENQCTCLLL
ncbi:Uncharacterised protein [Legionella quateirensis]|uniref:Uncharacterized protein n=1 Tax=Legionella quateirensis TaxID=45072 RepID=A0A378KVT8_9GAMM|nr:hypothetical protein Lqua_1366 [Legionella quateirensis]STY17617.1 Uncharacterised protein [Legionella quateirensis]